VADGEAQPLQPGDEVTSGVLYRRIYPDKHYFKAAEGRATSLNFLPDRDDPEQAISMFRAAETTPSEVLEDHDRFGLLELGAETFWALGLRVIYTPQWGKGHVSVLGFTKRKEQPRRDAAFAAHVLIAPTLL
jgi:hypothetical protein